MKQTSSFILQPLSLSPPVRLPGRYLSGLINSSIRPRHHHAIDLVDFSYTKGQGQFGLRQVTRAAFHGTGLRGAVVFEPDGGTDRVAIRYGALQPDADRPIAGR
jgi:hypothetical protein